MGQKVAVAALRNEDKHVSLEGLLNAAVKSLQVQVFFCFYQMEKKDVMLESLVPMPDAT